MENKDLNSIDPKLLQDITNNIALAVTNGFINWLVKEVDIIDTNTNLPIKNFQLLVKDTSVSLVEKYLNPELNKIGLNITENG